MKCTNRGNTRPAREFDADDESVWFLRKPSTMLHLNSSRASVALIVLFILLSLLAECSTGLNLTKPCSRTCVAKECNSFAINYGKYCGAGYTGCPGEAPCDDLDACCRDHDNCVDKFGMLHVKCHVRLRNCLTRAQKSGKAGFSKECPASTAAPTMIRGMNLAIQLCQLGNKNAAARVIV